MSPEQKLKELNIQLPTVPTPIANFVMWRQVGNLLYLSGQGPRRPDGSIPVGRLGLNYSVEQGYADSRQIGLQILATVKQAVGSLDRIEGIVKLLGMVNAEPDFGQHPKVINGCSDVLVEILGERGKHARSAVGMGSLPNGMPVEIEAIIQVSTT
ncbi:RidA family protein [Orrella sp. NBD-18]|uniref:RidA family protein n=1 Tax=Sheuella amnicola TaxID=2707330 RepID=A0A6B2R1H2_9BURK|nr:RidA family protein [Sheuella amnicola]NDY82847.1 RidA family protein [Sheuella amnicola]HBI84444.1 hypothetical protein [Alcaligenaceae bacterium]